MTDKLRTWKQYIETAFSDNRPELYTSEEPEPYPRITKAEIERAIQNMQNNKSPGPDEVRVKLKLLCDSSTDSRP